MPIRWWKYATDLPHPTWIFRVSQVSLHWSLRPKEVNEWWVVSHGIHRSICKWRIDPVGLWQKHPNGRHMFELNNSSTFGQHEEGRKKTKLSYLSCWRAITYMYIYVYITCSHPHKFIYVYNMCKSHVYIYINITCVMYYSNINNMYIEIYLTCTWYHVKIRFVDQNSRPKKIAVSCINWHWLIGDRLCWDTCLVPSRIPSMECLR